MHPTRLLAGALALACLPSCTTMATPPVVSPVLIAQADATLDRIERGYAAAKAFTALFLPYLPPARAEQVREVGALVDRALITARTATTVADRLVALRAAEAELARYQLFTGN